MLATQWHAGCLMHSGGAHRCQHAGGSVHHGWSFPSASWAPDLPSLGAQVRPGELVAVVGRVGAGKSSLASALLGGMAVCSCLLLLTIRKRGGRFVMASALYVPHLLEPMHICFLPCSLSRATYRCLAVWLMLPRCVQPAMQPSSCLS
jgi:hypothetical protein